MDPAMSPSGNIPAGPGRLGPCSQEQDPCNGCGYVVFEEFKNHEDCFNDPLDSRTLSIFFVTNLCGERSAHPITSVDTKCVQLPYKDGFVILPQMHQS